MTNSPCFPINCSPWGQVLGLCIWIKSSWKCTRKEPYWYFSGRYWHPKCIWETEIWKTERKIPPKSQIYSEITKQIWKQKRGGSNLKFAHPSTETLSSFFIIIMLLWPKISSKGAPSYVVCFLLWLGMGMNQLMNLSSSGLLANLWFMGWSSHTEELPQMSTNFKTVCGSL